MKKREEINIADTWDLTLIYKDEEQINIDKERVIDLTEHLLTYKELVMDSEQNLLKVLELDEQIEKIIYKLYMYYHLQLDLDLGNGDNQNESNKIISLVTKISSKLSFITPEITESDKLESYIESDVLKDYKRTLTKLLKQRKHVLPEQSEKILSINSPLNSVASNTYSVLVNSDLTFESVQNNDGKDVTVNEANYSQAIRSTDRTLRENFFKSLLTGYKKYNQTLTTLFNGELQSKEVSVTLRHYTDYITRALENNEVNIGVYNNLVEAVNNNLNINHDYLKLRKELLNLNELHLYDTYVSIIEDIDTKYEYETAKELVLDAFKVFGSEYTDIVKEAFDNRWIDVYPTNGKRSGAYSSGSYETVPYILLNYTDGLDDVFTLAHELGHSMHTYLTNKNQNSQDSHYKIFVAEIASTVNELVLLDSLYKKTDDINLKKYLLNYNLDQFRTTVYRQTMFAEFEQIVNNKYFEEKSVSSDYLNETYLELNKKYFGPDTIIDEEIKYEWSRIPHFYYDFYVYQYATSFCIATYLAEEILNGNQEILTKYLTFLKSGDTTDPISLVREMGVDITTIDPLNKALEKYEVQLNRLKKIIKEGAE